MASVAWKLRLPRLVGMLMAGIILGPYVLDLLDPSILAVSSDLRQMALIIILLKAGLSLDLSDLKKVGRPAIMMAFVPACFEIIGYLIFTPYILGVTRIEAAVMGAVIAAVSPAVVVPRMVRLMESGYGKDKSIPQLIIAGASCDDVFVIVLFSAFTGMAQGTSADILGFIDIPVSIILGVVLGAFAGYILSLLFERAYRQGHHIQNSIKAIIVTGVSFLLVSCEKWLEGIVSVSGLLAVIGMACMIKAKSDPFVSKRMAEKFGKLWLAAEVILFVLVGAAVDIRYTLSAGFAAVLMIFIALIFRSFGVMLCLLKTTFSMKERIFCILAYLPKATVQAAIGSVPLALGLPCGKIVLSVAVMAILITAPFGAAAIDLTYRRLLQKDDMEDAG